MIALFFWAAWVVQWFLPGQQPFVVKEKLSEYGFFTGPLSDLHPAGDVYAYDLNTPLFSNYAEKRRFVRIPAGTRIQYRDSTVFYFPEGTVLIKNFYYPRDFRKPEKGSTLLETRLLVHQAEGWQAYPYIWNDEQTEAVYDPAGEMREIRYINASGKKITTPYAIPNKNQCKGCHLRNDAMVPVGPSARQLNRSIEIDGKRVHQLRYWQEAGILEGLPPDPAIPAGVIWDDPLTGSLNDRARAYLDANCAHCHSRTGPANTSGLYLDVYETDPLHLGVNKSPVAAGRGSGNLRYDIVPGAPSQSILFFRMQTNDPSIAMPEIGREQVHREALDLIEEWIRKQNFSSSP